MFLQTSDQNFSELNKKMVPNPFEQIHIDGYSPSKPWCAPAALAQLEKSDIADHMPFPTVEELDNEIDFWPDSVNPFHSNLPISISDDKVNPDQVNTLATSVIPQTSTSTSIPALIQSHSKLYFISHKLPNNERKEWRLIQVNLDKSMRDRPQCLQDGNFYCHFYIQHPKRY